MNVRWFTPDDNHLHYYPKKKSKLHLHRHPHTYDHCEGRCESHSDFRGDPDITGSYIYEDDVAYTDSDVRATRRLEYRKYERLMKKLKR